MKKIITLVCAAVLTLGFTSCEDVPAPYTLNTKPSQTTNVFSETFASSLGKFTNYATADGVAWKNSYNTATATGYDNTTKTTTDGEAYLVSPTISLEGIDTAYVSYDYVLRFNRNQEYQKVMIAEDFVPKADNLASQAWTVLIADHAETPDYNTFYNKAIQIPEQFMGKKIRLALYFKSEKSSSTWEVKNLKVAKGLASASEDPSNPDTPSGENSLPYTSASLKDGFTVETEKGTAWSLGSSYAKATGYNGGTTTATVTTLISPAINTVVDTTEPIYIDFDYVLRYVKDKSTNGEYHQVLISTDKQNWTKLEYTAEESGKNDWTFYAAPSILVPEAFMNKEEVYVAFRFECNAENSTTWELKNLSIHQGATTPGDDPTDNPGEPVPTGDNLLANGNMETWNGGQPACWKSASTASSATLTQSNEAHSGSYSVEVGGTTSSNKRLGSKEITLKAGTYNLKFYAKAATSSEASVRPGYVPIGADGKVGSYVYGDYTNNITTSSWVEINHSFTLSEQTTICIVVMNPKNPGTNVLIDDMELTTENGGLVGNGTTDEGGNNDQTPTPADGAYTINFTSSMEGWTINDVELGELSYVWQQNKTYGMKASAYKSQNYATESWLTGPEVKIGANATLTINHALNFLNGNNRADFINVYAVLDNGNKEEIALSAWPAGTDYTYIDGTASLSKYEGKTIKIAFEYKSTSDCAPTYEVKSLSIK